MTGDYSRGAAGFWVEGGAIGTRSTRSRSPATSRTCSRHRRGRPDIDVRGGIRTGSILLEEMTIAGD